MIFHLPKGHLIFRLKTLHSLRDSSFWRGCGGSRRRSREKLKKVTKRKVAAVDLSAEGSVGEATSPKVTWYIMSASKRRCLGNYTWREKKVL